MRSAVFFYKPPPHDKVSKEVCPIRDFWYNKNVIIYHMSDHATFVEKARAIVEGSHLSRGDKEILLGRLPYVADVVLKMFIEVCKEDLFSIEAVVRSLKKKLDAQGNLQKLHEIVRAEREEVEELLANG